MADPYESLANAIITTAAKDYMTALKILKKLPANVTAQSTVDECERFFRSSRYAVLTSVDSEFLIRRLREEALKE